MVFLHLYYINCIKNWRRHFAKSMQNCILTRISTSISCEDDKLKTIYYCNNNALCKVNFQTKVLLSRFNHIVSLRWTDISNHNVALLLKWHHYKFNIWINIILNFQMAWGASEWYSVPPRVISVHQYSHHIRQTRSF